MQEGWKPPPRPRLMAVVALGPVTGVHGSPASWGRAEHPGRKSEGGCKARRSSGSVPGELQGTAGAWTGHSRSPGARPQRGNGKQSCDFCFCNICFRFLPTAEPDSVAPPAGRGLRSDGRSVQPAAMGLGGGTGSCPGPARPGQAQCPWPWCSNTGWGPGHRVPGHLQPRSWRMRPLGHFLWVCGTRGRWVMAGEAPGVGGEGGSSTLGGQWRRGSTRGGGGSAAGWGQ